MKFWGVLRTINLSKKPTHILFDKSHLEQVLIILCENTMQHGRNELSGEADINLYVTAHNDKISLRFCDTGPGILGQNIKNIFDPFFTTQTTGNGMGLYLARDICQINHSSLEVLESDEGACFVIHFNQQEEVSI